MRFLQSMNYKVKFTQPAIDDLDDIYNYYETELSKLSADKVIKSLREATNLLTFSPEGGIDFNKRIGQEVIQGQSLKMFVAQQYLIFYIVVHSEVRIMRIISTKTNYMNELENLFKNFK